jgi:hypothetical protein
MDEQDIRKWAYDRAAEMTLGPKDDRRALNHFEILKYADNIAAWVMSGKRPDAPEPQPETDQ